MKCLIGTVLASIVLYSGVTVACGGGEYPVMSTQKDDGTKIGLFVSQAQIERTQSWTPAQGEPPLGLAPAYQVVKQWWRAQNTRYDDVNVREITLRKYGCSLVADRWYYVIDLNPVIDGNELWGSGNWVAVLMDGTVIGSRKY